MWKLYKDGVLYTTGTSNMIMSYIASLGDVITLNIDAKQGVINILESKKSFSRSEQVSLGIRRKQFERFKRHKGFIDAPGYKFCTSCLTSKTLDNFGYRSDSPDGYARHCKTCVNLKAKKYRRLKRRQRNE